MRTFIISLMIIITFFVISPALPAKAQENSAPKGITVLLDQIPLQFDVQPIVKDGHTLVPFRTVAEALNIAVDWDGTNQIVTATKDNLTVQLKIGSFNAARNGRSIGLEIEPTVIDGRTLIPLRFFAEAFDCQVNWDGTTQTISILSPANELSVIGFYALGDKNTSSWKNLFTRDYPESAPGHTDLVSELALGWYSLDSDGNLLTQSTTGWRRPEGWEDVLTTAKDYTLKREMVVHVTDKDRVLNQMLGDETAGTNAAASIVSEAKKHYQGINLNFEGLGFLDTGDELKSVQNKLTNFISLLSSKLENSDLTLTLTVHAPNSAYLGYDYKALGQLVDRLIIMAYDYGPVPEPNQKVLEAVAASVKSVPAEKLVLGISIPNETPDSFAEKIGMAKRYNLQGIALWRLGLLSPAMWEILGESIR